MVSPFAHRLPRHGQTPARRLHLPESEPLWRAGRGFVVRDLPWTVEKLHVNSAASNRNPPALGVEARFLLSHSYGQFVLIRSVFHDAGYGVGTCRSEP